MNYRKYMKSFCEGCGITDKRLLSVYPIDKNPKNNQADNFETLCCNCHHLVNYFKRKIRITLLGKNMLKIEFPTPIENKAFSMRLFLLLGYSQVNKVLFNKNDKIIGWVCSKEDMNDILKKKYKWPKRHLLPTMKDVLKMATTRTNQSENHSGDFRGLTVNKNNIYNYIKENEGMNLLTILNNKVKDKQTEAKVLSEIDNLIYEKKIETKGMRYFIT